eukprot:12591517-Alexandrium_andersonii.AAC.1
MADAWKRLECTQGPTSSGRGSGRFQVSHPMRSPGIEHHEIKCPRGDPPRLRVNFFGTALGEAQAMTSEVFEPEVRCPASQVDVSAPSVKRSTFGRRADLGSHFFRAPPRAGPDG